MNVNVENSKNKRSIEEGDVLISSRGFAYLVIKDDSYYMAKNFNGCTTATGMYTSIDKLVNSLSPNEYTHYSKRDFEIVLKPKE